MLSRLGHGLYKKIDYLLKIIFRCIYIIAVIAGFAGGIIILKTGSSMADQKLSNTRLKGRLSPKYEILFHCIKLLYVWVDKVIQIFYNFLVV